MSKGRPEGQPLSRQHAASGYELNIISPWIRSTAKNCGISLLQRIVCRVFSCQWNIDPRRRHPKINIMVGRPDMT